MLRSAPAHGRPLVFLIAFLLLAAASPITAQTVVLQNDSVADFGQTAIQAGFVASERAAAWLTPTCSGDLTAVRILWLSLTGGTGNTLADSITISSIGTFPQPNTQLIQLSGPVLTDGFFNEFLVVPPVAVSAGERIVVDLRFFESPPITGPSVVTDIDGCQVASNGIFAIPPSIWLDACILGVSGDFAIRAVVECGVDNSVFLDGFESGDTSAWSEIVP